MDRMGSQGRTGRLSGNHTVRPPDYAKLSS